MSTIDIIAKDSQAKPAILIPSGCKVPGTARVYPVGSSVPFICPPFTPPAVYSARCLPEGKWDHAKRSECSKGREQKFCPYLENYMNRKHRNSRFSISHRIVLPCPSNYRIFTVATCSSGGIWKYSLRDCQRVSNSESCFLNYGNTFVP